VVQHLSAQVGSRLSDILDLRCALPVRTARGGETLLPGCVFVAPSARHLLIGGSGKLALSDAAPDRFVRPSANLLFQSAAMCIGAGTIAVVLTGRGDDGTWGVLAVKRAGGTVIAQDAASSTAFGMPGAAIASGCADFVLPLVSIAPKIRSLVGQQLGPRGAAGA